VAPGIRRGGGPVRGASSRREEEALVWSVRDERGSGGDGGLMAASVSTWDLMLEIWPVEERPEQMKKREFVNALSFNQMVTYDATTVRCEDEKGGQRGRRVRP
jgi:hypothetical protein